MNKVATSTIAIPTNAVNSPAVSELSLQESRQHFRRVLHTSLARSLIGLWWSRVGRVLAWLGGRKEHFPFVALVLFLNAFTLLFSISVSLLFGQTAILQPAQLLPLIVWDCYGLLYILVMHSQRTYALHILDTTIADSIASPHDFSHLESMIQRVPRFIWQFSFSLLFALVAGLWIPYVLAVTNGTTFLIGQLLLYTINYFQMGMYAYFQFGLIVILLGLSRFDLDIYANDPSNSMVIRRVYQASNTLTLSVAALSALHYLLISLLGVDISAPMSWLTLIVLGWLPPLALFITTHVAVGRIMTRVKGKKLAQVQGLIQQTERGSDLSSPEAMETIKQLMDYHDRIKITPNSMVNFGSLTNLLGSLLLPLIAMVLANLDTIIGLFS